MTNIKAKKLQWLQVKPEVYENFAYESKIELLYFYNIIPKYKITQINHNIIAMFLAGEKSFGLKHWCDNIEDAIDVCENHYSSLNQRNLENEENMPYIKQEKRDKLDPFLNKIKEEIETGGDINYCITKLCIEYVKKFGKNYKNLSECISTMECAKEEFYRKHIAPYEDLKEKENGGI